MKEIIPAVILAGGQGSRMGELTRELPKPLLPVAGKPIIEYQISFLRKHGITEIYILSGYKGEKIKKYCQEKNNWGIKLYHIQETEPLGTAGAVASLTPWIKTDFLVLYGDLILDVDLDHLVDFHRRKKSLATLVIHPNDHPNDSDLVEAAKDGQIIAFHFKPRSPEVCFPNLVNAGLYILSSEVLAFLPRGVYSDFGRHIFPELVARKCSVYGYLTAEYIKDIGTPARLKEVEKDLLAGKVNRWNRQNKRPAIFLDRDGVLNEEKNGLRQIDDLAILKGVPEAIKKINQTDYLALVITNQPQVAKGFISEEELNRIHAKLETILGQQGAYLNKIYYCPHHPEIGFEGERKELKIKCHCRKPEIGLIEQATQDFNIDLSRSFLVGDSTVDIMTGRKAALKTILLRTGWAGRDGKYACRPDFIFEDLPEAVDFIIETYKEKYQQLATYIDKTFFTSDKKLNHLRPVIIVAGLARSGKSTVARIISFILQDLNYGCRLVELDNWLLNHELRTDNMTVRERYLTNKIIDDVQALVSGKEISFHLYDPLKRGLTERRETVALGLNDFLIIDGVIGLDLKPLREIAGLKIYVEVDESKRRERFKRFYFFKGLTESEIIELYEKREKDESPIVRATKKWADLIIQG